MAEQNYDEASTWLDDAVGQMRASLGERPDSDEVGAADDFADEFEGLSDL